MISKIPIYSKGSPPPSETALTPFAIQLLQGRTLSIKQLEIARKRMMKYSKQLMGIANAR